MKNHKEPEWTAQNINRKRGDTTFEICGWCEYASCGSCRYNCLTETSCSLLKDYSNNVYWDTLCKVKHLGKADFESIIRSKKYYIEDYKNSIKRTEDQILVITKLKQKAKYTPPLPDNRVPDYYNVNDIIWLFYENKWNRGTVVLGYRHHNGGVSYVLDDFPESRGSEEKGGTWGCGYGVPGVLKDWEYNYFKKNIEKFEVWLRLSDREYNGERCDIAGMHRAITL